MRVDAFPQTVTRPRPLGRRVRLASGVPVVLTLGAVLLWLRSIAEIDSRRLTDVGLISALPPPMFIALGLLTLGFVLALRAESRRWPILLLHVLVLIFMLYGMTALVEEVPRFQPVWKHAGIIEYIARTGRVDPEIDAYFNWPVFFILAAFGTKAGGLASALSLASWTPVALNLLYLCPLVMTLRAATTDRRLIWLGVWFFYVSNWIGQDYFSPQGFSYFLYLVILAVLVTWFKVSQPTAYPLAVRRFSVNPWARLPAWVRRIVVPDQPPSPPASRAQRAGLIAVVAVVFAAMVGAHQLTPFATLMSVTALVVFNRCTARALPIYMGLLILLWLRFMATPYLSGHLAAVTGQVGSVETAVSANVTNRFSGSPGHVFVIYTRAIMTLFVWGVAGLGAIRRLRGGRWDLSQALLAIAPFPLLVLQPYGGEMLLRVYFFSLPFMAFFAASLFYPSTTAGRSWWTTIAISLGIAALLGGFLVIRYGNERMDRFTQPEVDATEFVYGTAQPGSLLLAGTSNTPWKYREYEKYRYHLLSAELTWDAATIADPATAVARLMKSRSYPASYLLITRSQIAQDELFGELKVPLSQLERALVASGRFRLVYANADARVYALGGGVTP